MPGLDVRGRQACREEVLFKLLGMDTSGIHVGTATTE
jgi:hypothetical protein